MRRDGHQFLTQVHSHAARLHVRKWASQKIDCNEFTDSLTVVASRSEQTQSRMFEPRLSFRVALRSGFNYEDCRIWARFRRFLKNPRWLELMVRRFPLRSSSKFKRSFGALKTTSMRVLRFLSAWRVEKGSVLVCIHVLCHIDRRGVFPPPTGKHESLYKPLKSTNLTDVACLRWPLLCITCTPSVLAANACAFRREHFEQTNAMRMLCGRRRGGGMKRRGARK